MEVRVTTMNVPYGFGKTVLAHLPFADGGELSDTDDLAALGLDSMGIVQLLADLEEEFGIEVPDELITEDTFATAGSLWQAVGGLIPAGRLADA
jgi:acyl carrier protein